MNTASDTIQTLPIFLRSNTVKPKHWSAKTLQLKEWIFVYSKEHRLGIFCFSQPVIKFGLFHVFSKCLQNNIRIRIVYESIFWKINITEYHIDKNYGELWINFVNFMRYVSILYYSWNNIIFYFKNINFYNKYESGRAAYIINIKYMKYFKRQFCYDIYITCLSLCQSVYI